MGRRLGPLVCLAALLAGGCRTAGHVAIPDTGIARSSTGLVAFVRPTPGVLVPTSLGDEQATELWVAAADGSRARRLVVGTRADSVERALAALSSPIFSPDGRRIYFESRAWVTSDAIHAADVETGREWFIAPATGFDVIPRGELAGCLLVSQHRYRPHGGSYEGVWLLAPDGRELATVADSGTADGDRQLAEWKALHIPAANAPPQTSPRDSRCAQ